MEFCRKRTNGESKAGDRKVGRKGEKKALRDGVGMGWESLWIRAFGGRRP